MFLKDVTIEINLTGGEKDVCIIIVCDVDHDQREDWKTDLDKKKHDIKKKKNKKQEKNIII